jgi:hypothetical protein
VKGCRPPLPVGARLLKEANSYLFNELTIEPSWPCVHGVETKKGINISTGNARSNRTLGPGHVPREGKCDFTCRLSNKLGDLPALKLKQLHGTSSEYESIWMEFVKANQPINPKNWIEINVFRKRQVVFVQRKSSDRVMENSLSDR